MQKKTLLTGIVALSIGLTGCAGVTKQDIGTIGGGAIGGLVGSAFGGGNGRILGAVGGALVGSYLGNQIGKSMDQTDQMMMTQSMNTDQRVTWQKSNGASYAMTPGPSVNSYCRKYNMTVNMSGKRQLVHGFACKCGRRGRWVNVSSPDEFNCAPPANGYAAY